MNCPLLIRADAGGVLGTGHVMRMLALAQAWQEFGGKAVMASISCPELLIDRLNQEKVAFHALSHAEFGGKEDLRQTLALAEILGVEWIILDGYHFDVDYQRAVHDAGYKVMVTDDYGHCETWCANVILNQNIGSEERNYINELVAGKVLLGLTFALFRREFWNVNENQPVRGRGEPVKHLLVTLGGVDPDNVTGRVLNLLENMAVPPLNLRVLLGAGNRHFSLLEKQASQSRHHVQFIQNVTEMLAHYQWAGGVISAGGSTCYEWLLNGLRGAVVTLAENQLPVVEGLSRSGLAINLGWWSGLLTESDCCRELNNWLNGASAGSARPSNDRKMIDAWGGHRITGAISGTPFWMRAAQPSDALSFFELANESEVRRNAFSSAPIQWNDHIHWFYKKLRSDHSRLYAAFIDKDTFIGQTRFDLEEEGTWLIDYSLLSDYRGKGWGAELLRQAIQRLAQTVQGRVCLRARVKAGNVASSTTFRRLNFAQTGDANNSNVLVFDLWVG